MSILPIEIKLLVLNELLDVEPLILPSMCLVWRDAIPYIRRYLLWEIRMTMLSYPLSLRLAERLLNVPIDYGGCVKRLTLGYDNYSIPCVPTLLSRFVNLERLHLSFISFGFAQEIEQIFSALRNAPITHLSLWNCNLYSTGSVTTLLSLFPALTELGIYQTTLRIDPRSESCVPNNELRKQLGRAEQDGRVIDFGDYIPGLIAPPERVAFLSLDSLSIDILTSAEGKCRTLLLDFLSTPHCSPLADVRRLTLESKHWFDGTRLRAQRLMSMCPSLNGAHFEAGYLYKPSPGLRTLDVSNLKRLGFTLHLWRTERPCVMIDWVLASFNAAASSVTEAYFDVVIPVDHEFDEVKEGWEGLDAVLVGLALEKVEFTIMSREIAYKEVESWLLKDCLPRTAKKYFDGRGRIRMHAWMHGTGERRRI